MTSDVDDKVLMMKVLELDPSKDDELQEIFSMAKKSRRQGFPRDKRITLGDVRDTQRTQSAAHSGLVHAEHAPDLKQSLLVKIIRRQKIALFGVTVCDRLLNRPLQQRKLARRRLRRRIGSRRVIFIEWLLAARAPVVVHVALGERGAQPAHQRAAAAVGEQRATPLAVAQVEAVKLGVELIGQIAA